MNIKYKMQVKSNHFTTNPIQVEKIKLKNGQSYSVRINRKRYFFPDEWMAFFDQLNSRQKLTFNFLINTGARIEEIRNIKVGDVDFERNAIIVRMTKVRNRDGSRQIRLIPISSQFSKYLKHIVREKNLKSEDYWGILSTSAANIAMKGAPTNNLGGALKKAGILDWSSLSVHNVRKTLEVWLIVLNVDSSKLIKHFGHSLRIAAESYVSSESFMFEEKKMMRTIIGDLYEIKS